MEKPSIFDRLQIGTKANEWTNNDADQVDADPLFHTTLAHLTNVRSLMKHNFSGSVPSAFPLLFGPLLAAAISFSASTSVRAASLVVMATDTTSVVGAKVYTIGVQITAADVSLGGHDPVMFVQNATFAGNGTVPLHQTGTSNVPDVQLVQTQFIDASALSHAGPPSSNLGMTGNDAFYRDSWWYNSSNGTLNGVVDSHGGTNFVTTSPAGDGSGVYTLGTSPNSGTNAVGVTGYVFTPAGSPGPLPSNPTTGQTMTYSGLFGPLGNDYLNPSPGGPFTDRAHILGDLLVANGGILTVPLAQIVTSANLSIPSNLSGGAGTFLEVGAPIYNVLGGPANVDPHAILDVSTDTIHATPEPSTIVLAILALAGLIGISSRRYVTRQLDAASLLPNTLLQHEVAA